MQRKLPNANGLAAYLRQGLSNADIAQRYGVSAPALTLALKRAGLSRSCDEGERNSHP